MNSIVQKSENFIEILQLSVSSKVKQLDPEKIERAFEWAQYFEKVHEKFKSNPAMLQQLDEKLKTLVLDKKLHLGSLSFGFDSLEKASSLLHQNFLSNTDFPPNHLPLLYKKAFRDTSGDPVDNMTFIQDMVSLVEERAALTILSNVQETCERSPLSNFNRRLSPATKTAASLFRLNIETATATERSETKYAEYLSSALQSISSTPSCLAVVLSSLLAIPAIWRLAVREESPYYSSVISWLRSRADVDHEMALLPTELIERLVPTYFELYRAYIGAVVRGVEKFVVPYAVPVGSGNSVKLDKLKQRLVALLRHPTCDRVRKHTREVILAKAFRGPGKRVWNEILELASLAS